MKNLLTMLVFFVYFSHLNAFAGNEVLNAKSDTLTSNTNLEEKDVSRFTDAIALINEYYVKPVNEKNLLDNAIKGIIAGLDPHSEYLDQAAYKTLLIANSNQFNHFGMDVTSEYDVLKVVSPIDDTPAAKAGVKSGDYIVAANDKLVSNMSFSEALNLLQGQDKGSKLTVTILRKGEDKPLKFTLSSEETKVDSVKVKVLNNNYGYIRISEFVPATPLLVRNAITNFEKTFNGKLKGLAIDLRNNPGGLLQSAVDVTNSFLDSGKLSSYNKTIVTAQGQLAKVEFEAKATSQDLIQGAPLIILINEGSASASEVVAGALQDYQRAIIVGSQSFGKGSLQSIVPIDNEHALKLTTGLYFTPAGRQIQNQGIIPDVIVENLKVTGDQSDDWVLGPIHEYELKNHLKGTDNTRVEAINNLDLAQKDFQLYEAIKILEAMSAVKSQANTSLAQN